MLQDGGRGRFVGVASHSLSVSFMRFFCVSTPRLVILNMWGEGVLFLPPLFPSFSHVLHDIRASFTHMSTLALAEGQAEKK
jgi:hypothetical protein